MTGVTYDQTSGQIVLIESIHLENSDSQYILYEKLRHTFALHCDDVES